MWKKNIIFNYGKRMIGNQEGQLTLLKTLSKNPEIETNEELLYIFQNKNENHIKDKIRQQERKW